MLNFLQQFVHYMCSRCEGTPPHHREQNKIGGRHSHNGEILDLLDPVPPTSDRILAAFREWQKHDPPANIQAQLAQAYNRGGRVLPATAEERAVKIILDNYTDTWIRHGEEQPGTLSRNAPFPDPHSRIVVGSMVNDHREQNWFAVDLDSTPFQAFEEHTVELTSGYPWTYTVGLLPRQTFLRLRGELHHPHDRDHLYARCNIPAKHWVFLYRAFDAYTLDRESQEGQRQVLWNSGVPAIHITEYRLLTQLVRHLTHYSSLPYSRGAVPR